MTVNVPQEVMDRVNNELFKAIVETPQYIQAVVTELLNEHAKDRHRFSYDDPDKDKNLFERLLREKLREMINQSMTRALREKYSAEIDRLVDGAMVNHEKLDGTLAMAFAKMLRDEYKVTIHVDFKLDKS